MGYQLLNSAFIITDPYRRIRPISKYLIVNYQELESFIKSKLSLRKKYLITKMEESR